MPDHPNPSPQPVTTERLRIVPADAALTRELAERPAVAAQALHAAPPHTTDWPPELFADHLSHIAEILDHHDPTETLGWYAWAILQHAHAIDQHPDDQTWIIEPIEPKPRLVGIAMFLGPPEPTSQTTNDTTFAIALVEDAIGYGLGTETTNALAHWASHPNRMPQPAQRILADVMVQMDAAKHMLRKCGFRRLANGPDPGTEVYARQLAPAQSDQ